MKNYFVYLFSVMLASAATAQPAPDPTKKAEAKKQFLAADKEYKAGHYGKALEQYYQAYSISNEPLLIYNIGQCYRNLGRYKEAIESYQEFIVKAPKTPFTPKAEKWIAELTPLQPKEPETKPSEPEQPQPEPITSTQPSIELRPPDAMTLQQDQLRLELLDAEGGLAKAKRMYKLSGVWGAVGLAFGGATVGLMKKTLAQQDDPDSTLDDIKESRRNARVAAVVADSCVVVAVLYARGAYKTASKEKAAKIEFSTLPAGGELTLAVSW